MTRHIYSVGGGRVARFFIGEDPGYLRRDTPLTVEDVRDHFDEIDSTDDFMLLATPPTSSRVVSKLLG